MALNSTHVFWAPSAAAGDPPSSLHSVTKDGVTTETLANGLACVSSIVATDEDIYWTSGCREESRIERMKLADHTITTVARDHEIRSLVLDGDHLIFATGLSTAPGALGESSYVKRVPTDGGEATVLFATASEAGCRVFGACFIQSVARVGNAIFTSEAEPSLVRRIIFPLGI